MVTSYQVEELIGYGRGLRSQEVSPSHCLTKKNECLLKLQIDREIGILVS